jgi:transposase InsO family protein
MRFCFIDAEKAHYPVTVLCRVLKVRRSGFYAWLHRAPSPRAQRDHTLGAQIHASFVNSRNTYGSPRIRAELAAKGVRTSKRRVARLMQQKGLCARRKRRATRTTDSRHKLPVAPNVLQRNFTAPAKNRVWTTDMTYLWTLQGWLYLAVILDLFSRRVVGFALSPRIDEDLALSALRMALVLRSPEPGLVHHSDRGSPYCGARYQALLNAHGIVCSMSRKGDCYDNAPSESFFSTLKQELYHRQPFATHEALQAAVTEYLWAFYNPIRRHSTLGFVSPLDYEERTRVANSSA